MSYRRDSDVYYPYGYIIPRNISNNLTTLPGPGSPSNLNSPLDRKSLKNKTGLVAWITSHCDTTSRREHFVKELQKYIPVHAFGKCVHIKRKLCPQSRDEGFYTCYDDVQSKYKFYLSYESSLCKDYISEKFFLALQTDMVPVVYGGGKDGHLDYLAIAPEESFIDARKFKSPKELAEYLLYLDKNDDEYLKYFEWKVKYQVVSRDYGEFGSGWCNLCQRVYEELESRDRGPLRNKWYSDLLEWWNYARIKGNASPQENSTEQTFQPILKEPTCVKPCDLKILSDFKNICS